MFVNNQFKALTNKPNKIKMHGLSKNNYGVPSLPALNKANRLGDKLYYLSKFALSIKRMVLFFPKRKVKYSKCFRTFEIPTHIPASLNGYTITPEMLVPLAIIESNSI